MEERLAPHNLEDISNLAAVGEFTGFWDTDTMALKIEQLLAAPMANVFSLSKARKTKARAENEAQAAENRVKFGRTKAEKQRDAAERRRAAKAVDAHQRDK